MNAKVIQILLLFALSIAAGFIALQKIDEVTCKFETLEVPIVADGEEDASQRYALEKFVDQSLSLQSWSLLLLSGILAISITTKVHKVPFIDKVFIINGPAIVLLTCALYMGWQLQAHANYLVWNNYFDNLDYVNQAFRLQKNLLQYSILILASLAFYFLVNIIIGNTTPHEKD